MKAVVLAAGEGQRLRPFTASKPKVMIKVGNKPILQYVVEALKDSGVFEILMVVGYRKESVMNYFEDGKKFGVEIDYVFQRQQIGTAHALKQVEGLLKEDFIVVPGDNIIDSKTISQAIENINSIVFKRMENSSKYGVIKLDENSNVTEIIEKPPEEVSYLVNTGIYHLNPSIFEFIGDERDLPAVINLMIKSGVKFKGVESDGLWLDIVYPWDIPRVNELALNFSGIRIAGRVESGVRMVGNLIVSRGCIIRSGSYLRGPVVIGENCEIGPNTVIGPFVSIGNNTQIGAFCVIENSVIGNNVKIGHGSTIEGSVIDSGTKISQGFTAIKDIATVFADGKVETVETGAFFGERCKIGPKVIAMPGVIVGNDVEVAPLKVISGNIPDGSRVL